MGLFRSSEFRSGTRILFQQSTAPVGWTKDLTHNDKSLRVVNGAVASGGTVAFSTFAAQTVGNTTLSVSQIPTHDHSYSGCYYTAPGRGWGDGGFGMPAGYTSGQQGGGQSHTHSLNMSLQYVDTVICVKN